jgi:hypothetical protein
MLNLGRFSCGFDRSRACCPSDYREAPRTMRIQTRRAANHRGQFFGCFRFLGRLRDFHSFRKTCAGTAPSLRCIGRLQHSVLIKNGRSWRKHLSMSVSRGRSSKDTLLLRVGTRQRLRKAVKGNKVKLSPRKTGAIVRGFHLVAPTRMHPLMTAGHVTKTFFQATTGLPPKAAIAIVAE